MGGAPLILKILAPLLRRAKWDVLPLIPFIVSGAVLILAAIIQGATTDYRYLHYWVLFLVGGILVVFGSLWAVWFARTVPRIPDEDDVPSVPIDGGDESMPGAPVPPMRGDLTAVGSTWFRDELGRKVLLRGINVSGSCKLPMPPKDGSDEGGEEDFLENEEGSAAAGRRGGRQTCEPGDPAFYDWQNVTFVGRPFPLDEADVHLARLRSWGLTVFRLLFTWEAVEHSGPGEYDEEYLEYILQICRRCHQYGISVFLDSHQDVWSRWTGGDGAPAWTLRKVGFDLTKLHDSGAAYLTRPEDAVPMAWNSNNSRIAAGTMWTLFFAGNDFAPRTAIDGEPVQNYLQRLYCSMLSRVAEVVKDEPNVIGFDIMNEPSVGFVGVRDARDVADNQYWIGWRVDIWSAILLGAGFSRIVDFFSSFMVYDGRKVLNEDNVCAWAGGSEACVWRQNGVWDMDASGEPMLKDHAYFSRNPSTGGEIDFQHDYAEPFWQRCTEAVRKHMPDAIIFVEPVLDMTDPSKSERPRLTQEQVGSRGFCWAKHCYDGITLLTLSFHRWFNINTVTSKPVIGLKNIQSSFGRAFAGFKKETENMGPGGSPVLIGECGIPFAMPANKNFTDLAPCTCALNNTMRAIEIGLVSCTVWNYTAENSNRLGDDWNGEDLSLFSADQHYDPNELHSGGRSLAAAVRPYALRTAGEPQLMKFDPYRADRRFTFTFVADNAKTNETIIFLPSYHYTTGAIVSIAEGDGKWELDWAKQTLTYYHRVSNIKHTIIVTKATEDNSARARLVQEETEGSFPENS